MNEINALLKELLTILQQTKKFAIENAPMIAQQKIQSEIFNIYVFWFSLLASIIFVAFIFCVFYRLSTNTKNKDISEIGTIGFVISSFILMVPIIAMFIKIPISLEKYYKLKNAPQLYLLEWVKSEIKK